MQILPVIDLRFGYVVRGVAGRRAEYRPIESRLCNDARPSTVARAIASLGFGTVYVADLDAIAGNLPDWETYTEVIRAGLSPMIDAGLTGLARARVMADFRAAGQPLAGIVAGLESTTSPELLGAMLAVVGAERLVFSLDLKAGQPLTTSPAWSNSPLEIAATAVQLGVRRLIVLDLARVGVGEGVGTEPLCREIRAAHPDIELIAGGGVRSNADLESLQAAGCNQALVASALHDGRLTRDELAKFGACGGFG